MVEGWDSIGGFSDGPGSDFCEFVEVGDKNGGLFEGPASNFCEWVDGGDNGVAGDATSDGWELSEEVELPNLRRRFSASRFLSLEFSFR